MAAIKIKPMRPEDVEQVYLVEEACFSVPWSRENFQNVFRYKANYYLTAWEEETIVGFIGLMAVAGEGDITNVAVLPSHRKQGIGDRLVSAMITLAKEKEISRIMLEVRASNEAAIHLYEKYGFEFLCIRKNYYQKPTEDANIMCWQA
ncbi:MAG: ribosomal-protein-alanine N-acetyltransferase [Lachnospiraceae bacterium]|nr:ribosomal-protein-alanine N-acetyltransferase [Lachnospiraceae bacterium]